MTDCATKAARMALLMAIFFIAYPAAGAEQADADQAPIARLCQAGASVQQTRMAQLCSQWQSAKTTDKASWAASIRALDDRLKAFDDALPPRDLAEAVAEAEAEVVTPSTPAPEPEPAASSDRLQTPPAEAPHSLKPDFTGGEKPAVPARDLPALGRYIEETCRFDEQLWCRLQPRNSFKSVAFPDAVPGEPFYRRASDAIRAFNGGVFDGRRLYFFGGGHAASYQNSVYALDLQNLLWERLYDPDPLDDGGAFLKAAFDIPLDKKCFFPKEGKAPAAGHTWGSPLLLDGLFHLWISAWGCDDYGTASDAYVHAIFDIERREWIARRPVKDLSLNVSAASPIDGRAFLFSIHRDPALFEIDLKTDAITRKSTRLKHNFGKHGIAILVGNSIVLVNQDEIHAIPVTKDAIGDAIHMGTLPATVEDDDALRYVKGRFILWAGGENLYQSADLKNWKTYGDGSGPRHLKSLFNKFFPVPALDVLIGISNEDEIWLARIPDDGNTFSHDLPEGFRCSDYIAGKECGNLQAMLAEGGSVTLPKGIYAQCAIINKPLTLDGNGSILQDTPCRSKAALILNADAEISHLTCRNIAVNDGNGACIRQQTAHLSVDDVTFENAQSGILTDPKAQSLTVKNSLFQNLGGDCRIKCGRAHGIYFAAKGGTITILNSRFLKARHQGHLIKSGAERLIIKNSVLDERGGEGSRAIDAFNGGEIRISDSELIAEPRDGNKDVIGFAYEQRVQFGDHQISIENSKIDCAFGSLIRGRINPKTTITNSPITQCRDQ
ncbi:nitrous oxide reductase family maturation protein NosD [alpha proteobacterium Q-1]|nr:nitrous oxide reductase family maturation protein NosD [alpha proteobacterium Q-1]